MKEKFEEERLRLAQSICQLTNLKSCKLVSEYKIETMRTGRASYSVLDLINYIKEAGLNLLIFDEYLDEYYHIRSEQDIWNDFVILRNIYKKKIVLRMGISIDTMFRICSELKVDIVIRKDTEGLNFRR